MTPRLAQVYHIAMTHAAATSVPHESDWLCEGCGYVLTGLPPGGRCPECGKLTAESAVELRSPPAWERPEYGSPPARFLITTLQVLFRPTHFYRSLATRSDRNGSARFAQVYLAITSLLFGICAWLHLDWFTSLRPAAAIGAGVPWPGGIALALGAYLMLFLITRVAAHLTTLEANYRGIRLPLTVVRRGLDYHAAHYVPVALVAAATVIAYRFLLRHHPALGARWGDAYLYTLCAEVVLGAAYLFKTYWIGMRNMMYASR